MCRMLPSDSVTSVPSSASAVAPDGLPLRRPVLGVPGVPSVKVAKPLRIRRRYFAPLELLPAGSAMSSWPRDECSSCSCSAARRWAVPEWSPSAALSSFIHCPAIRWRPQAVSPSKGAWPPGA